MIGQTIGSYLITGKIGEGGMGAVYLGKHEMLGRQAAVKVLLPQYSHNKEIVARFFNEARATTTINHPGIVQVFDFGQHSDGSAFIVMELLRGESLDKRVARHGCLDSDTAARLIRQAAGALGAAHDLDIVHRDLKPENLFLVPDPDVQGGERVKVLDFGIAKLAGGEAPSSIKTRTGALMGTPVYMSPEQCRGAGEVDLRADVYSLGCVWFHLLCGRPPFLAEGLGEIIASHMMTPPPRVRTMAPDVPEGIDEIIDRTLAKDPDQRFSSMAELIATIDVVTGGGLASAPGLANTAVAATLSPGSPSVAAVSAKAKTTLGLAAGQAAGTAPPAARGSRSWMVGLGLAAIAIAAVVWVVVGGEAGEGEPAAVAPASAPIDAAAVVRSPPPPPDAPPPPRMVTIEVLSTPSGANVIDASGQLLGRTPYRVEREVEAGTLRYTVVKSGYVDGTVELSGELGGQATAKLRRRRIRPPPGGSDDGYDHR